MRRPLLPHPFAVMRGGDRCGRCGVRRDHHRRTLRCALGLHDDGSDAFGGFSTVCWRCYRPI
jgi:hypothetical protein